MKINFETPLIKKILHILSVLYHGTKNKKDTNKQDSLIVSIRENYPKDWEKILGAVEELIQISKKHFDEKHPFFTRQKTIKCSGAQTKKVEIMKFYSAWHPSNKDKFIKNNTKRPVTQIKIINSDGSVEEYLDIIS